MIFNHLGLSRKRYKIIATSNIGRRIGIHATYRKWCHLKGTRDRRRILETIQDEPGSFPHPPQRGLIPTFAHPRLQGERGREGKEREGEREGESRREGKGRDPQGW